MAKLDVILEKVISIEKHLEKQNGQVFKNTQFRIRSYALFGLVSFVIVIAGLVLR